MLNIKVQCWCRPCSTAVCVNVSVSPGPSFRCKTSCVHGYRVTGISPLCYWFSLEFADVYMTSEKPPPPPGSLLRALEVSRQAGCEADRWSGVLCLSVRHCLINLSVCLSVHPLSCRWTQFELGRRLMGTRGYDVMLRWRSSQTHTIKSSGNQYCGLQHISKPHGCSSVRPLMADGWSVITIIRPLLLHKESLLWCSKSVKSTFYKTE